MKMDIKIVAVILISLGATVLSITAAKEFIQIEELRQQILRIGNEHESESSINRKEETLLNLVKRYKNIGDDIDRWFPRNLEQYLGVLNTVWLWARTQAEMRSIEGIYMTFRKMQRDLIDKQETLDDKQWSNFAKTVLNDANASIPPAQERIADFIVNQRLFVSAYKEASNQICNTEQSSQQLLYNLYKTIALIEIKGYTMMQFSLTFLKFYKIGNFTKEMEEIQEQSISRASEMLRAVKMAMAIAPRDIWKCDPSKHKPESTFTNIKMVQGYIVNEVDMNPLGTCKENCEYYSYSRVYGCYQNQFCNEQRPCNGKLVNCQYVDSDMWICPSESKSDRRYEYVEYENGRTYGKKGTCNQGTTKVDSWWRWLFWHCSYCMCFCDDHNSSSHRYFNLRDVSSDVQDNKVVTGMKLIKRNQIIHIQIQQGKLLPYGGINSSTIEWKEADNYSITDQNIKEHVDYHTIMWEKRAIDLDDLDAPEGHLLTGLKFRIIGAHLNLEIRTTPFNFTSGKLIPEKSLWDSHDNTEASEMYGLNGEIHQVKKRIELQLNKPDIPTRSLAQSVIDSQTNQFLLFQPTDLEKDAAQNTVPFIDIQPVIPNPPMPLSGAGIFHKGREGYGGFLALKAITYNFEPHMHAESSLSVPVNSKNDDSVNNV
ncbi:PREDICTED: uncharacterized protein LOC105361355 isoform X2 [Ceratosolen solmsi marchali]|uniref:Uncharacterized protein LOC105361355 isoform X2 n=1 Tax=Ceratosolen solmsi marchali TaxID=326594 RepID=A0AAJ6YEY3_9HYME|nr:PREDICTED: uncharacterized protein LOC105361355 isoform X2 [Ceratosolen solmsi marchali]